MWELDGKWQRKWLSDDDGNVDNFNNVYFYAKLKTFLHMNFTDYQLILDLSSLKHVCYLHWVIKPPMEPKRERESDWNKNTELPTRHGIRNRQMFTLLSILWSVEQNTPFNITLSTNTESNTTADDVDDDSSNATKRAKYI